MTLEDPDPLARTPWARDRLRRLRNRLRGGVLFGPALVLVVGVTGDSSRQLAGRVGALVLLTAGLSALLMAMVLGFGWPPRTRGIVQGEILILRYDLGYRLVLPAMIAAPGVALMASGLLQPTPDYGLSALAFAVMVIPAGLFAVACRAIVEVTDAGVASRSPWSGKQKSIAWSDVTALEIDGFRALVLRGADKAIVKAHLALDGLPELVSRVRAHVRMEDITVSPTALEIMDALETHPAVRGQGEHASAGRVRAWPAPPALTVPAALLLLAGAVYSLRLADTALMQPVFELPAGWVRGLPTELSGSSFGGGQGILSVAHEPVTGPKPGKPAVPPGQLFWAEVADGELDAQRAAGELGDTYLARARSAGAAALDPVLLERAVTTVSGVEVAHVALAPSEAQRLIVYAVPLRGRIGFLNYTCAVSECDRVRPELERAVAQTVRLAASANQGSPASRRWLAVEGIFALFVSALLGTEAAMAVARKARA